MRTYEGVNMGEDVIYPVRSVAEYIEEVVKIEELLRDDRPLKKRTMLFRGQGATSYKLMPAIGRNRKNAIDISLLNQERNLIELARYRIPEIFNKAMEPIERLSLLQHYGIATRLLDVTSNALAALFFACSSDDAKVGEVIVFDHDENDVTTYPVVNAIADSYRFLDGTINRVDHFYEKVLEQPYFLEQRHICKNFEEAEEWFFDLCSKPIFVNAPATLLRQKNQSGQFILFPNYCYRWKGHVWFSKLINAIDKKSEWVKRRIWIRPESKSIILRELRMCGIDESRLFPDNYDVICKQIMRDCGNMITY